MLNNVISIFGTGAAAAAGDYESIATVTVGSGGSSSISFTSIPSTYKHLQVRILARSNRSSATDPIKINFNNDTTAGNYYRNHFLKGDGANATANVFSTNTYCSIEVMPAATATANIFVGAVLDILDYTSTNKNKTLRTLCGFDTNSTTGQILFQSGLWYPSTIAAINRIDFVPLAGTLFTEYSHFALYGVKG